MTQRLLKAAGLACLLCAATGHAQELGRAETSLTGLTYRLVDLAPDDGITPSIQFNAGANLSGYIHDDGYFSVEGGGPFSTGTHELISTNGLSRARLSGIDIQASATVDETALRSPNPHAPGDVYEHLTTGNTVDATRGLGLFDWIFTLSPHTALVMEGHSSQRVTMDLGSLADSDLVAGEARKYDLVQVNASSWVYIRLDSGEWWNPSHAQTFHGETNGSGRLTKNGWVVTSSQEEVDTDFSLRHENNGDQAVQHTLTLNVFTQINANGTLAGNVPEPDALLLTLVGAGVLAFALRRRRMDASGSLPGRHRTQQQLHGALAATLAWSLGVAHAQSTSSTIQLGEAQASVRNLSYRLVDLDPDDGITPWIRFEPVLGDTGPGVWQQSFTDNPQQVEGADPFTWTSPAQEWAWRGGGETLTVGAGSAQAKARLVMDDKAIDDFRYGPLYWERYKGGTVTYNVGSSWQLNGKGYVLSPRTALIVEGISSLSASFDEAAFRDNSVLASGFGMQYGSVRAQFYGFVSVELGKDIYAGKPDFRNMHHWEYLTSAGSAPGGWGGMGDLPLLARYDNDTALESQGRMAIRLSSSAQLIGNIPEPDSVALALAGSGILALALRRRKAA